MTQFSTYSSSTKRRRASSRWSHWSSSFSIKALPWSRVLRRSRTSVSRPLGTSLIIFASTNIWRCFRAPWRLISNPLEIDEIVCGVPFESLRTISSRVGSPRARNNSATAISVNSLPSRDGPSYIPNLQNFAPNSLVLLQQARTKIQTLSMWPLFLVQFLQ